MSIIIVLKMALNLLERIMSSYFFFILTYYQKYRISLNNNNFQITFIKICF